MENTEHTPQDLNANELAILNAAYDAASANGQDFGFVDEIEMPKGLKRSSLSGYMSQLSQKDYVICYEDEPGEPKGMFVLTTLGLNTVEGSVTANVEAKYEPNTKTLDVNVTVAHGYDYTAKEYRILFELNVQVEIPETLTPAQERRIARCIHSWANQHMLSENRYEFKEIKVTKFAGSQLVFLIAEIGLINDIGTLASVLCRNRHHVMIGKRGGLDAQTKGGKWVDGRDAVSTTC